MARHTRQQQQGSVLITALFFLVLLTLISITAMRSSTLALRMAGNEQEHRRALQSTQSAVSGVLANAPMQVANVGVISCYQFAASPTASLSGVTCSTTTTLDAGPGYGTANFVAARLDTIAPCPRTIANSTRGQGSLRAPNTTSASGNCAYFTVTSRYDDVVNRGGAAETSEGVIKLAY